LAEVIFDRYATTKAGGASNYIAYEKRLWGGERHWRAHLTNRALRSHAVSGAENAMSLGGSGWRSDAQPDCPAALGFGFGACDWVVRWYVGGPASSRPAGPYNREAKRYGKVADATPQSSNPILFLAGPEQAETRFVRWLPSAPDSPESRHRNSLAP